MSYPPPNWPGGPHQPVAGFPGGYALPGAGAAPAPTPVPAAAPLRVGLPEVMNPNPTVYIRNLNEKVKLDELRGALNKIFSQFGTVLEVKAEKRLKLKGQAWIIFDKTESAQKAVAEMKDFKFYDKPMVVAFAKVKSDVISKADGTFVHRPKRKVEKKSKKKKGDKRSKTKKEPRLTKAEPEFSSGPNSDVKPEYSNSNDHTSAPAPSAAVTQGAAPPNRILFVENLPAQCTELMLSMLFRQHAGFKEARLVPGKSGIAFVEFQEVYQASVAKEALHEFKITPSNLMKVSFARQ